MFVNNPRIHRLRDFSVFLISQNIIFIWSLIILNISQFRSDEISVKICQSRVDRNPVSSFSTRNYFKICCEFTPQNTDLGMQLEDPRLCQKVHILTKNKELKLIFSNMYTDSRVNSPNYLRGLNCYYVCNTIIKPVWIYGTSS